jgi:L-ascorbate metabolism protein UlaG (beta-lactamase superfamily)
MGDYGQPELTDEQVAQIGRVDILLTRWLDWSLGLIAQLKPKVVIPMHADRPDAAMTSLKGLTQKDVSEMEFKASTLPRELQCILLKAERGD